MGGDVTVARPVDISYERLKPGPAQSPEQVRVSQRARIHWAMVELIAERGFPNVTVRSLLRTSGVSSRTLYAYFANFDDCFASTYHSIIRTTLKQIAHSVEHADDPEQGLREAMGSLFTKIARNPHPARLALIDSYDTGPAMLKEMDLARHDLERFIPLAGGGPPASNGCALFFRAAIVAGVERVVRRRLLESREAEIPGIADDLVEWARSFRSLHLAEVSAVGDTVLAEAPAAWPPVASAEPPALGVDALGDDRGRVLSAVARLELSVGYWNLTAPMVRREAGVSRRRFDALFAGLGDCLLEAAEALLSAAARKAMEAACEADDWQGRVCRGALAFCSEVARRPQLAQLGFADLLVPGRPGLSVWERLVSTLTAGLIAARPDDGTRDALAVEASVASSWYLIQAEVTAGRARQLPTIAPLIAFLLLAHGADADESLLKALRRRTIYLLAAQGASSLGARR
jgi:AcrR family transcriptional regulator